MVFGREGEGLRWFGFVRRGAGTGVGVGAGIATGSGREVGVVEDGVGEDWIGNYVATFLANVFFIYSVRVIFRSRAEDFWFVSTSASPQSHRHLLLGFSPHNNQPIHTPRHTASALLTRCFYQIS